MPKRHEQGYPLQGGAPQMMWTLIVILWATDVPTRIPSPSEIEIMNQISYLGGATLWQYVS